MLPDGARIVTGTAATPTRPTGRTLVLGGARSGKSAWAEAALSAEPEVTYVATSGQRPDDREWAERVRLHQDRRPAAWRTNETTDLVPLLRGAGKGDVLLIDCLTLWLAAAADDAGVWEAEPADPTAAAEAKLAAVADELLAAWRATRARVVVVSNEIGSGVVPATASGRRFRDELGRLNARLAAESEHVVLLVAGQPIVLK